MILGYSVRFYTCQFLMHPGVLGNWDSEMVPILEGS